MAGYEDYKPFKIVSVLQSSTTFNIDSVYDAAKFLLEKWPEAEYGPKYQMCKAILLKCLEGNCSAAVARVAFVEAAREANIYVETMRRPPPTGKLGPRWGKRKSVRRS